jgi:hypothetical protein
VAKTRSARSILGAASLLVFKGRDGDRRRRELKCNVFDVGGEFFVKFRFNSVEAARGEDARDEMEKKIKEFFGSSAQIRIERSWFQSSVESSSA